MIPLPTILDAARLEIGGVKVVVVFLEGPATASDYAALQQASAAAGFEGDVVAVWPDQYGRTRFFARPERHAFFQAVGYDQLRAQINARLELS
jgi:ABC-type glycerol-3-phosphate transport system substrate-binding protein